MNKKEREWKCRDDGGVEKGEIGERQRERVGLIEKERDRGRGEKRRERDGVRGEKKRERN